MGQIGNTILYPFDVSVSLLDYLLGTDATDNKKAKSYQLKRLVEIINIVNGGSAVAYHFSDGSDVTLTVLEKGYFFSQTNIITPEALTQLHFNNFTIENKNISAFFQKMIASGLFKFKLSNLSDPNNFIYLSPSNTVLSAEYLSFDVATFNNLHSGNLINNADYVLSFDLASNLVGTSDPLKLDKSTYVGNAQDLDDRLDILESQTDVDNAFIVKPTFSLLANTLTIGALGRWSLEGVAYTNPATVAFPITFCASGKTRLDYFVPNNLNGFTKVSGVETLGMAIAPQLPNEGLYVTYVLVSDSTVGEPTAPSTKKTPTLQQVLEAGFSTTKFIWFWNTINSKCTRFASDHILFQKLESVFNFIKSDHTTQSYTAQMPNKLGGAEQTFAMLSDLAGITVAVADVTGLPAALATKVSQTEIDALGTQLLGGAPADGNTLKELNDKIIAVQAIIGSTTPDGDSIINTLTELLAVFSTYSEGVDLAVLLNGKVNTTDIYNALDCIVAGKVLDARQGKVLNDLITALTAVVAGKEPANANIQSHIASAHAPSNAQKNSDITKAEIEAVYTGEITTHTHPAVAQNADITIVKIGTNTLLDNTYNGKVILLTASCTLTLPNGLALGFNYSVKTRAGVTLTYALGGLVVLMDNTGTTMAEKLSHTMANTGVLNEYLSVGNL